MMERGLCPSGSSRKRPVMSKRESGRSDSFWLWDGEVEYEGQLVSLDEAQLTARMRQTRRWTLATGAPGKPIPGDLRERQRAFARRVCFGQSPAIQLGTLLEVRIEALQPSRECPFDYVFFGSFSQISDEHLLPLSQLSTTEAARYLEGRRLGRPSSALGA